MGHRGAAARDLKDSAGLDRLRAAGRHASRSATTPANVGGAELVAVSTAIPRPQPRGASAAGERGIPVLRRAEILAAIAATRRTPGGGRHPRQDDDVVDARPGAGRGRPASVVHHRRRGQRDRHRRGVGRAASGSSSRPTRATAPSSSSPPRPRVVTNVEADHLDHYGDLDALVDAFDRFLAAAPGPRVVVRRRPGRGRGSAARHGAITYGTAADADYRIVDVDARPDRRPVRASSATATRLGEVDLPVPGLHNARNAAGALAVALELGVPFDGGRRRPRPVRRASPAASSSGARPTASPSSTTTPTSRPRSRPRSPPPARAGGGGSCACSSPTATAAPRPCGADFADAFVDADLLVVTDIYAAGEAPRPGVTGKLVVDAVLDAHPWRRLAYLPRRRDARRRTCSTELRPGDLCLTLGAGDLTRSARRGLLARSTSTGDGPRERARSAPSDAVDGRSATVVRARRAARAADHLPRRRGGGPVRRGRAEVDDLRRASAAVRAVGGLPVLVVGKGRTCSSPTPASPGWPSCSATRFAGVDVRRRRRCGPGARPPCCRSSPAARRAAGLTGLRVGGRRARLGRRRGAHERRRPRLRHGRQRSRRVRVVDLATGEDGARRARGRPRPRLPPLGARAPPGGASRPSSALAPGRPRRGRGRDRRDRALAAREPARAARTPARCSPTRRATPPAG